MVDPIVGTVISIGGGFVIYKVIPALCEEIKTLFNRTFYQTVVVTLAQDRQKALNLLKFISAGAKSRTNEKSALTAHISIDGQRWAVPLNEVPIDFGGETLDRILFKVATDAHGNITSVSVRTYKRRFFLFLFNWHQVEYIKSRQPF